MSLNGNSLIVPALAVISKGHFNLTISDKVKEKLTEEETKVTEEYLAAIKEGMMEQTTAQLRALDILGV